MSNSSVNRALAKNEWTLAKHQEMTLLFSPLLQAEDSLTHAFTTRMGGASSAPLESFNLGRHWDTEESKRDAMENRRRLCDSFSIDSNRLAVPGQQHTSNVEIIGRTKPMEAGPYHFPAVDALATENRKQPILLHFADCVPVMLLDRKKKKICVIHAGWRGTASGIVRKSVELMVSKMQCSPKDILAAVGPAIGSCCYETGADVAEKLQKTVSEGQELIEFKNGKAFPDLKAFNSMQLLECGVEEIDVSSWCTACHPEVFYSHRQSGGKTGRQGALMCIK